MLSTSKKYTFIDLFAGIGGFRIALQNVGFKCVFSSEWDKNAQETYMRNYGVMPFGDITSEETKSHIPEHFDILCGGFPCQPFSICGKKKGFEDTRGTLFFEICKIVEKHQPKCLFLENVQHLTKHDHGQTFRVIVDSLNELGYNVSCKVLNAKDFGLPQFRDRIFIVAAKNAVFNFSKVKTSNPCKLEDFLDKSGNFEILDKSEYTLLPESMIRRQEKSGLIFCGYRNKSIWKKGVRPNTLHLSRCHRQPNRIYSVKGTHPTIPSQETSGSFFIYIPEQDLVRKLTINECYRIMGGSDTFVKHSVVGAQYKQIGNSVAIPVIQAIADQILEQKILEPVNVRKNVRLGENLQISLF